MTGAAAPVCLCQNRFYGVACLAEINDCTAGCSGKGACVGGKCQCYHGHHGAACEHSCPNNCTIEDTVFGGSTPRGRCNTADYKCVCKEGYYGEGCETMCPNRCFGNGECVSPTECVCRDGYGGADCGLRLAPTWRQMLLTGLQARNPLIMITMLLLIGMLCFCCMGYCFNRWRGRFGTSAIPLWDYYAKRWRNAPLFEPIFAVSATTQTTTTQTPQSSSPMPASARMPIADRILPVARA